MKLSIFNEQRTKAWWNYLKKPQATAPEPLQREEVGGKNGLACNTCGGELIDVHPTYVSDTFPARVTVRCSQCGISEWRVL